MQRTYSVTTLAIPNVNELVFGNAPRPVKCGSGLEIGAGTVFPKVNFTLPPIGISKETWPEVLTEYEEMTTNIVRRAVAMKVPGVVLEFELLPATTEKPERGAEMQLKECIQWMNQYNADGKP